jgi:methionyl-tRNA synthetase
MSKSKGTFITAQHFAQHVNPDLLRYYYASKLSSGIDDLDFNLDDFVLKVNSDLLGKIVNIASRLSAILLKKWGGCLTRIDEDGMPVLKEMYGQRGLIERLYQDLSYSKAIKEISRLADHANQYIDQKAPWSETDLDKANQVCTAGINFFKILFSYLKPVIPETVSYAETWLNCSFDWNFLDSYIEHQTLNPYSHLLSRLDIKEVKKNLIVSAQ